MLLESRRNIEHTADAPPQGRAQDCARERASATLAHPMCVAEWILQLPVRDTRFSRDASPSFSSA
eukprot:scaffold3404_cov277-Prasinococcus_capsulatus_cf.AAC.1